MRILEAFGAILFWVIPFLPFLCLFLLLKETKKLRFSGITVLFMMVTFGIELFCAINASDFHVAAFLLQLFMPAQFVFTGVVLIVGNIALAAKAKIKAKKEDQGKETENDREG